MKSILGFLGFVLIAAGVSGLLSEWVDRLPTLFGFSRFLIPDGHEVAGYTVMTVLGLVVAWAADAVREHASSAG
ncbi:hypothetical protein OG875_18535 [Streptomyces sp. NBC_01498]|uniref:hypothetical protein n=1 Tax=Streptomyces sp. NBC_01498 TaxID=2975870 RepID=UPI002E7BDF0E|nr:hypothetical protein [Streptomyces sp. NBC_01498]WTL26405.1 hypothetical protein OG875_18535 [Streptomyces sp. NBC_01498]